MRRPYRNWSELELEEHRRACMTLANDLEGEAANEKDQRRRVSLRYMARTNRTRAQGYVLEMAARSSR